MPTNYTISTLRPGPSINFDDEPFAGDYLAAVAYAQAKYREHGRSVYVMMAGDSLYWWHCVRSGVARDRNTGSGVPAMLTL